VPAQTPASHTLILSTTTSTQDSGLLDVLVPLFERHLWKQARAWMPRRRTVAVVCMR
jgi:ABC-type tungstate transport system permease subunit